MELIRNHPYSLELTTAKTLAQQAGQLILEYHHKVNTLETKTKQHANGATSPVTIADEKANVIICAGLRAQFPQHGVLSEEDAKMADKDAPWWQKQHVWIIDPLDGTENFIKGGRHFGVHIGLLEETSPVVGVNYYPCTETMYWAVKGQGANKQVGAEKATKISCKGASGEQLLPLRSRSDRKIDSIYEELLQKKFSVESPDQESDYVGSTGLRLCLIAEGVYNLYIATAARAGLWDYLSGEVILREAGAVISDWQGHPLDYRQSDARLGNGVLVCGNQQIQKRVLGGPVGNYFS